ncbi:hypothetical protein FIV42_09840 [Persicimonas caeni]|uniref:DUF5683 domain-containing protein n=1 Tax=Persicimonas caeni TaxID=2292766 RepID=A0A4Y6PRS7_PERCE|nr:hypothetical protein [Persicimonas caeni]QDG51021.1 hypothetical protein FIV42_09840 [Persicimonas caeni]QED32242.1 hypothetical protein FRD00_09835 [Persicimonas caeni]
MADMTPSRPRIFLLASFLVMLLIPSATFAQGSMDFGVEEVEEEESEGQDGAAEDDGTMTFGAEEVQEEPQDTAATDSYTVAVVAIPSEAIDRDQRIELQQKMLDAVSLDPNYRAQDGAPVLNGLEANGIASCVTEPLCLSGVGQDAGVDRILIGRVEQKARGLSLNVDLFDVNDKLFVKYTSVDRLGNFDSVLDSVEPAMKDIFDIRVERKGPNYGEEGDSGTVQKILAWTAAGLSVASLGAGIYFGMEASDGEDAIIGSKNAGGQFTISQAEAQQMLRDVEGDALTANVLYGASAGLAVISGILFYVESGSDVAAPEGRRRAGLLDRVDIQPSFGVDNVGLGASFKF